ncbi:hypothetical protein KCP69_16590 [Salmonella enterica subsp. enterica]|nr:hypothetical protein KCP69_16590 [Salmonella enterica subsp. enterica]
MSVRPGHYRRKRFRQLSLAKMLAGMIEPSVQLRPSTSPHYGDYSF